MITLATEVPLELMLSGDVITGREVKPTIFLYKETGVFDIP